MVDTRVEFSYEHLENVHFLLPLVSPLLIRIFFYVESSFEIWKRLDFD